jgi:hypothetical protein
MSAARSWHYVNWPLTTLADHELAGLRRAYWARPNSETDDPAWGSLAPAATMGDRAAAGACLAWLTILDWRSVA